MARYVYGLSEGNKDQKDLLGGKGTLPEMARLGPPVPPSFTITTEACRKATRCWGWGGDNGGDPVSIHFFHRVGPDRVSCSPYRAPVARLDAGRAAVSS